ncbi:MAG: hypothetical protein F6K10_25580, partial [Moorea sp. SIO2B7]|nr:hypothetical protein [Moorena sp. SIO2B7]
MKPFVTILSLVWLVSACGSATTNLSGKENGKETGNVANCPSSPAYVPEIKIGKAKEGLYQVFDYQIRNIVADKNTIKFESLKYDFVFCRGNDSWSVQPGNFKGENPEAEDYEDTLAALADPPYKTVELNGKTYQYRVTLDPNPFPDLEFEPKRVVFELIKPDSTKPQSQVLYTFEQMKKAQTGIQLGFPSITATVVYDNRVFWAIAPEQGEGNGGIATIVSYNPENQKIGVIQPEKIKGQQITDLAITGDPAQPTFWIATQMSGEGNPFLPGMGLVAYRPNSGDYTSGSLSAYHGRNSPLVGAIPNKLKLEGDKLWLGTGNGICKLKWQAVAEPKNWSCWRFALMAKLPSDGLPIYSSVLNESSAASLAPSKPDDTVEVYWWSLRDNQSREGRYEVEYKPGFTVKLNEGAKSWAE